MPLRITPYQQQSVPSGNAQLARARGLPVVDNSGAVQQFAQSLQGFSDNIMKAQQRIQSRTDAIDRARLYGRFEEEATTALRNMETETDFSAPHAVQSYGEKVREIQNRLIQEHVGSDDSRLQLMERLESGRATLIGQAAAANIAQQKKIVEGVLGSRLNAYSMEVRQNPSRLMSAFERLETDVRDMSGALTEPEQQARLSAGRAALVESSIDWFVEQGRVNEAENLLRDTPGISSVLTPEKQQTLFNRIGAARAAQRNANQTVKGVPVSMFNEMPEQDRRKLLGLEGGSVFGEGMQGQILSMFASGAPSFAARQMSPEQERQFLAAVTEYTQLRQVGVDPITMQPRFVRNDLPAYVNDALRARGIRPSSISSQQPSGQVTATPPGSAPQADRGRADQVDSQIFAGVPSQLFEGGRTIAEMGGMFTGPVPAVKEFLGKMPGLGVGSDVDSTRTNINITFRRLVTALQQNPRFSEGERQSLQKDLDVKPNLWDNETAFINRMIGIDRALEGYEQDSKRALQSNISFERRKQEMDTLQTIQSFRSKLMPPRMESDDKANAFVEGAPNGTPFMVQDGGRWVVRRVNK